MNAVLIAPDADQLRDALQHRAFEVITWPSVIVQRLKACAALDEAIENLYGYDWIVFVNQASAHFFLARLHERGQQVSNLDSLRVCAIGEQTATALASQQVHVDVIAAHFLSGDVVNDLATYLGGRDSLARLNFLIPQAGIGRNYLKDALEDAAARADVVPVYETVAEDDATRLVALQSMLLTGSIDAVVFSRSSEIEDLAREFDTKDLTKLLPNNTVAVVPASAAEVAQAYGISRLLKVTDNSVATLADTLANHFA